MDFIDDELHDVLRAEFLSHAAACPSCQRELDGLRFVRNTLAALPRVEVTPEFDFRLKASFRLESARLRSPLYRLRLFVMENMASVVWVPAAAVLFLTAALLYNGLPGRVGTPGRDVIQPQKELLARSAFAPAESLAADVHYVLESAELSEEGLRTLSAGRSDELVTDSHIISLLSF